MRIDNPLVDKRIVAGLENALALEGLTKADGDADVNVTYHSSTTEDIAIDTTSWGYGCGPGWARGHGGYGYGYGGGPVGTTTAIRKYRRGTLVIDIWDARTKQLVWRVQQDGGAGEYAHLEDRRPALSMCSSRPQRFLPRRR